MMKPDLLLAEAAVGKRSSDKQVRRGERGLRELGAGAGGGTAK